MASPKFAQLERQLIRACEIVNQNPDVVEVERELGTLTDEIAEGWDSAPAGSP